MQHSAPKPTEEKVNAFKQADNLVSLIRRGEQPFKQEINILQDYVGSAVIEAQTNKDFPFQTFYSKLQDITRIHLDSIDGIKSKIVEDKKYTNGIGYYRDAKDALPLDERLPPNNYIMQSENMLLRAINTLRGVDFALASNINSHQDRANLQLSLAALVGKITKYQDEMSKNKIPSSSLKQIHEEFNTEIIKVLHKNNLDEGITTAKEFEKLLVHYSDLACVIDPAKSLETFSMHDLKHEEKDSINIIVSHTEIADPITKKTPKQKSQIKKLKLTAAKQTSESEETKEPAPDVHNLQPKAFRIATSPFADRIADDDTLLPAQSRNYIADGAKNAFRSRHKLQFCDLRQFSHDPITEVETVTLHSAAMVYVGPGSRDAAYEDQLKASTVEIIQQFKDVAAKEKKEQLHFTLLLTDSSSNDQDVVVKFTKAAADEQKAFLSHAPTNFAGLKDPIVVAKEIQYLATKNGKSLTEGRDPHKAVRILNAAGISLFITKVKNTINVVICNSGQDRTRIAEVVKQILWTVEQYQKMGIKITQAQIEKVLILSGHNAQLPSHQRLGSPGCKKDSRALIGLLGEDTKARLHLETADTNKSTPVSKEAVARILGAPIKAEKSKDKIPTETVASADPKESKQENITDENVARFAGIIARLPTSTHTDDINSLKTDINKIHTDKDMKPEAKLIVMATRLQRLWNKAARILNEGSTTPQDALIDLVNSDPTQILWLRIGSLLQIAKDTHPITLKAINISETNQRIIPERIIIRQVTPDQLKTLKMQLENCQEIKTDSRLDEIIAALNSKESKEFDAIYTAAIVTINEIWKDLAKASYIPPKTGIVKDVKKKMSQIGAFFTGGETEIIYVQSQQHVNRLNAEEFSSYSSAIATILQQANKEFGKGRDIIRPPITTLKKEKEYQFKPVSSVHRPLAPHTATKVSL